VTGARAQTNVTLTFDDGIATQNLIRPVLASHGMRGTFFINSGNVGANSYYMTWSDVDALNADGNEIGGHTVDHQRLPDLTPDQQRHEVCDDAAALRGHGYTITDFAYPFGAGSTQPAVLQAFRDCGYLSARKFGDLRSEGCTDSSCPYAESIPPPNPYGVRTPEWVPRSFTLADLQGWVTQVEQHGGGWMPIVFHDICNNCADVSVSLSTFTAFLDWLQPRAASGTVVKTVRDIIGPPAGFARPRGATPLRASLVPAYAPCTGPNAQHGGPLNVTSCTPPQQSSSQLTVGTLDANGTIANSVGSLRMDVMPGDPVTPADEADAGLALSLADVRRTSDLSDYTGELQGRFGLRITDKNNGDAQSQQSATVQDTSFGFTVPCAATLDPTAGATCSTATSADAITPGIVPEALRSNWQLDQIQVLDGGPDEDADTDDNTVFAVQGVFVP
jgi:peptidoglycan/xylan/chitin deacetylase (PgdA/CDA1 family)